MRKCVLIIGFLLASELAIAQGPADFARVLDGATPQRGLYPVNEDAQQQIASALTKAKSGHKRVLLVFGADWCYDCHVLEKAFQSRELSSVVKNNFLVLHINIGRGEVNRELQSKYGIDVDKGVPAIAVLDSRGRLISPPRNEKVSAARRLTYAQLADTLHQWKSNPPLVANR
jgi:thiol:disulfide interchange protein